MVHSTQLHINILAQPLPRRPCEETKYCSMRWYGIFLSSKSMGLVNLTEQIRKVRRNLGTGEAGGGVQESPA